VSVYLRCILLALDDEVTALDDEVMALDDEVMALDDEVMALDDEVMALVHLHHHLHTGLLTWLPASHLPCTHLPCWGPCQHIGRHTQDDLANPLHSLHNPTRSMTSKPLL